MKKQFDALSERERQVLSLAAIGLPDKKLCVELGVTVNTLRTYWERIRKKVGPLTRAALVAAYVAEQIGENELAFFEALKIDGWVMDSQSWLVRASDDYNERHGLRPGMPHHKKEYAKMVLPADREAYIAQVERVRTGEAPTLHVIYRTRLNGSSETVHVTMVGVAEKEGRTAKVYGLLTSLIDCRNKKN